MALGGERGGREWSHGDTQMAAAIGAGGHDDHLRLARRGGESRGEVLQPGGARVAKGIVEEDVRPTSQPAPCGLTGMVQVRRAKIASFSPSALRSSG